MKPSSIIILAVLALASVPVSGALAVAWVPVGPPGGDARSLAFDPHAPDVVYLGTSDGILYRSENAGRSWRALVPGFPERGVSLDEIAVDEKGRVFVAYWKVAGSGGGVARSDDGGVTFSLLAGIAGESVRALATAASRPDTLVAGTLTGVFRSDDAGTTWQRVSPAGHAEIRNIESIAIDPREADVIYAGTWHLAWKTIDGGKSWRPIQAGMIQDSDVFTLNLDRRRPETLYGTACSGIYRSLDGGAHWAKIHGIPASSRRTRAFVQHATLPHVFFAGTTEGLWRSDDDLKTWRLISDKELVVNAAVVLPSGRMLVGADGAGVARSEDSGTTWTASNDGFSERFVSRVLFDPAAARALVAIREDRQHGGVLSLGVPDGAWKQLGSGLEGREVLALALTGSALFAGTDAGVFRLRDKEEQWSSAPLLQSGISLRPAISDLVAYPPAHVAAASSDGLLQSDDDGSTWRLTRLGMGGAVHAVTVAADGVVYAATALGFFRSADDGARFDFLAPVPATIHHLTPAGDGSGTLLAATTTGIYRCTPGGEAPRAFCRCRSLLPDVDVAAMDVLANGRVIVASDYQNGGVLRSDDAGATWRTVDALGLRSNRLWTLAADPRNPERILGAAVTGGLHVLEPPTGAAATAAR